MRGHRPMFLPRSGCKGNDHHKGEMGSKKRPQTAMWCSEYNSFLPEGQGVRHECRCLVALYRHPSDNYLG